MKRALKVFTLVNFGLCLGGLVWLACHKEQPDPVAPSNKGVAKTGAPPLATLDDIITCLENEGGLDAGGACARSAKVDGLAEKKAEVNDRYFAASKAAVPVTMRYRDRVEMFVRNTLATSCETTTAAKPQPMQQAAPEPTPPSDRQLACLRTELARRTHKR